MSSLYLYPKWVRLWHLMNALLFLILIFTGISMQYTGRHENVLLIRFATAVKWHNVAALLLTVNYIIFVTGNVLTGNGKYYRLQKQNFWSDLAAQLRFYTFGIFRKEKHPFPVSEKRKFNPLQKFTYFLAMYLAMPLLIISGIGMFVPGITITRLFGVNGLIATDLLHVSMGFILSIFLIVHIYTCTLGATPFALFRGMISGFQETE